MRLLKSCRLLNANGRAEILKNARIWGFGPSTAETSTRSTNETLSQSFSSSQTQSRCYSGDQRTRQDLRRFLEEVGTDPKEARYWLRQFQQREIKSDMPFAVVEISPMVFLDNEMLNKLASCLSFLNRNGMPVVVVHGIDPSIQDTTYSITATKQRLMADNAKLVEMLEQNGAQANPFLCSSHVFHATSSSVNANLGNIEHVDVESLKWFISSGQIPILAAIGETPSGQVVCVDPSSAAMKVASVLKPTKVVFLNNEGGLKDRSGEVVESISVPGQVAPLIQATWLNSSTQNLVQAISNMLHEMPMSTSAVITRADSLIAELFTHNGSGTLFLSSENIETFHSLSDVNMDKLRELLVRSFDKELYPDYFSTIQNDLHTLYISESYSAAAIVIMPKETEGVPYLDKFTVSKDSQGQGTSESLWRKLKDDFSKLCWRSRGTNRINPWYFVRSNGSWTHGMWTVFWYGVTDQAQTLKLVQYANSLPSSFDPVAPHDELGGKKHLSTTAYHKYL